MSPEPPDDPSSRPEDPVDPQMAALPPHHVSEVILAHPRFPEARRVYVRGILGLYENDTFLSRLLVDAGRGVVFFTILCLHAVSDEGDRATWPSIGSLQKTVKVFGLSSARRVHEIVARFVETGYVASVPSPADRRMRLLAPTDRMLAHDFAWLAAHYAPLEALFPDPGYGPPLRREPAYQKAHRALGLSMAGHGAQIMANNPAVMLFMGREAGIMILAKLVERADEAAGGSPITFAEMGNRFGVSRTHVRKTLQGAEQAGLVRLSGQSVTLLPPILAAFDRFVADGMAGHDLMHRLAMRSLDGLRAD